MEEAPEVSNRRSAQPGDLRQGVGALVSSGGLLLVVLVILALGALLATDPETPRADGAATPAPQPELIPPPAVERPSEPRWVPVTPPTPEPVEAKTAVDDMVARTKRDVARLSGRGGEYTLQILLACDAENALRVTSAGRSDPRLYVLPALHGDRACFRICWGSFASRADAAREARQIPKHLRSAGDPPTPRVLSEVLP